MDISFQPIPGAAPSQGSSAAKAAATVPSPAATPQAPAIAAPVADNVSISNPAAQAIAADREAALSFKNVYAVSDTNFTIFKDASGKYITRYVSLRDGSVTYEPSAPAVTRPPATQPAVTITA